MLHHNKDRTERIEWNFHGLFHDVPYSVERFHLPAEREKQGVLANCETLARWQGLNNLAVPLQIGIA